RDFRARPVPRNPAARRIPAHRFRQEIYAPVERGREVAGRIEWRKKEESPCDAPLRSANHICWQTAELLASDVFAFSLTIPLSPRLECLAPWPSAIRFAVRRKRECNGCWRYRACRRGVRSCECGPG